MRLSLCTLGLIDRPLEECIHLAADIGYQGIEPLAREPHLSPATPPQRVRAIAGLIREAGLAVPDLAAGVGGFSQLDPAGVQRQLDDLQRLLDIAVALSCPLVRILAGGPEPAQATATHWERAAEGLQRAAAIAASYGVRLGLELHYGYLHRDVAGVSRLLDSIGQANVGVIYDPANLYVARAEYGPAAVLRLGREILHVHVKDSVRVDAAGPGVMGPPPYLYRPRPLGQGGVDYPPIVAALREIGYDGFLSDESHQPGVEGAEVARQEYAALRALISQKEQKR
ncbi:MAG: sugar phosphate isomerase/epimerase [Ardenticatenaceae bacterium]|nr:sugar phosphate isomerase/epimerase [Ardenticatenaceae bacterium]